MLLLPWLCVWAAGAVAGSSLSKLYPSALRMESLARIRDMSALLSLFHVGDCLCRGNLDEIFGLVLPLTRIFCPTEYAVAVPV